MEIPVPDPPDLQHVLPSLQQKAWLLAPTPSSPQHVSVSLHVVADRKWRQHVSVEAFGMQRGLMVPDPQQFSSSVHEMPLPDPPAKKQFTGALVVDGGGATVVVAGSGVVVVVVGAGVVVVAGTPVVAGSFVVVFLGTSGHWLVRNTSSPGL